MPTIAETEPTAGLSPELEVLLICARARLLPEHVRRLQALLARPLDWDHLLWAAARHGITPLLCLHLQGAQPTTIPPAVSRQLRAFVQGHAQGNLFVTGELLKLVGLLAAAGITAVPFKGPLLAAFVYGNLALRRFIDLDLLVHERDVPRARAIILGAGYRPDPPLTDGQEQAFLRYQYERGFIHRSNRFVVDLHWRVAPHHFSAPLGLDFFVPRLQRLDFAGTSVLTPSPEDLLLILCIHGSRESWHRLSFVCDVAELLGVADVAGREPGTHQLVRQPLNWSWILHQAHELGIQRMVALGLCLAGELLEAPLPEVAVEAIRADPGVPRLARQARRWLLQPGRGSSPTRFFTLQARERWRDRLRHGFFRAITPTIADVESLAMPSRLAPFYYAWRATRVIATALAGVTSRARRLSSYRPTPREVVSQMLALAEVKPSDVVYDLGCGDGRIVIEAAGTYGARGVGFDIDPARLAEASRRAREAGVQDLVRFVHQDAMAVDVSAATVVTLYLTPLGNRELLPRLRRTLRPGTRIVSHASDLGDWAPAATRLVAHDEGTSHVFFWRLDAAVDA